MKRTENPRYPLQIVLLFVGTALVLCGTLWFSKRTYGLGFPLDDAWIHQTYARNLAEGGEWAFISGQPSAGSTAPLWTIFLALGYKLGVEPKSWSYLLGGLFLVAAAWLSGRWLAIRSSAPSRWIGWVGFLVLIEWHLIWASVSGMEIPALITLILIVFSQLEKPVWNAWVIGGLIGLGVWIRPDMLSLLLPVFWHIGSDPKRHLQQSLSQMIKVGIGLSLVMGPYLLFNRIVSQAWWPSTFYAKQAEYAVMRESPFLQRLFDQFSLPFIGVGLVLIPGIALVLLWSIRRKSWRKLAPFVWVLAFLGLYALRLPVIYQHGRYAMPTVPIILVLGVEGLRGWVKPEAENRVKRMTSQAWPILCAVIAFAFVLRGAQAYAQDVAIIETEMVETARWISVHTEKEALIAAHDIGALGYFGGRTIIDLAGLVSPEVIPMMRDENALEEFLNRSGADYLMTFPGWYPILVAEVEPLYRSVAIFSPKAGGENMAVYHWGR